MFTEIFGSVIRTTINTATLPFSVVKDVLTLGDEATMGGKTATQKQLEKLKREVVEADKTADEPWF